MIDAEDISKRYNGRNVVDGVSLHVEAGMIYGLLGPNAAGKTTTIRMLCGIIEKDGGEISIDGMPAAEAKSRFGYVAQHFGQYEDLSVWENLRFYAEMYGVTDENRLDTLLARYDLAQFRGALAGTLSGGYQRRLGIACALAHDPDVLFLDEPTAGIDPVTRKLLWDDLYRLSTAGKTLFLTTHYMEEAQRCHRLAFLSAGRLVAEGTPDDIRGSLGDTQVFATRLAYDPAIHDALAGQPGVVLVNQFGDELRIVADLSLGRDELERIIEQAGGDTRALDSTGANLEDVFIALTQDRPEP